MRYTRDLIHALRTIPKLVHDDWHLDFEGIERRETRRRRLPDLHVDASLFRFEIIGRRGHHPHDFSAIVLVRGPDDVAHRLVRINGPHPSPHINALSPRARIPPETTHVHYLTERYFDAHQRRRVKASDGFALVTTPCETLARALHALERRATIITVTPTLQTAAGANRELP